MVNKTFLRGVLGAIYVSDICQEETLAYALKYKEKIDEIAGLSSGEPLPSILLANKFDKISDLE